MAHAALRLRRALPTLGGALRRSLSSAVPALSSSPPPALNPAISPSSSSLTLSIIQSRAFRSSPAVCLSSNGKKYHLYQEGDEITPDTILFPGCDYEHWLIVMEFPKDPKPTPEEMVRTYEETCAKGLNISLEEAKKRIYACSTTTYQGFQATMSEEESEKFQGLPGVVFVLPDSWIDPQNQEYGGDKYINGTIIPRPPPIQYNRGGRFRDRNRNPDPRRSDLQGGTMQHQQPQQENLQHNYRGPMQGDGRNYGAPQNYPPQQNYPHQQNYQPQQNYLPQQNYQPQQNYPPQQNFGTPGHGGRGGLMPNNRDHSPDGRDSYQADRRGQVPSHQPQQNYPPQQNYQPQQNYPPQQNFGTPGHGGRGSLMPNNRDHSPDGRDSYQADRRGQVPSHQGNINQGGHGDHSPQADPRGYGQSSFPGDNVNYAPPSHGGTYGQGEGERFAQVEQGNEYRGQRN